jgi:hypothetical protein
MKSEKDAQPVAEEESHPERGLDPALFVFKTRAAADTAIHSLESARFNLRNLSLIGKAYHGDEKPAGFYVAGEHLKSWGATGAFWSGIWAKLLSPAVFFLPGLGVVAMAGPVVAVFIAAAEGVVNLGGESALGATLTLFGASSKLVKTYEAAVKADEYVLVVHGDAGDARHARSILAESP